MRSFRGYSAISVWFKRSRDVFAGYRVVYAREFRAKAMQSPCAGAANSLTILTVAKRNSEEKINILNARQSDNTLFHRLVRKQRSQNQKELADLKVGQEIVCQWETVNGWYEHFKNLATKKDNDRFDMNFLKLVEKKSQLYMIFAWTHSIR